MNDETKMAGLMSIAGATGALVLSLAIIVGAAQAEEQVQEKDWNLYSYPSPYRPNGPSTDGILLSRVSTAIRDIGRDFDKGQVLPVSAYQDLKKRTEAIRKSTTDATARMQASRLLVLLDLASGKEAAVSSAKRLMELVRPESDAREANFTRGYAVAVLARVGNMPEAAKIFEAMTPSTTPQYGWFAFEVAKYYADYVHASVSREERLTGQPFPEEHQRSLEYSEFLKEVFFPKLAEYGSDDTARLRLEVDQFLTVFDKTAKGMERVLSRRLYMDVSKQTTEVLFPRLFEVWAAAAGLLKERDDTLEKAEWHSARMRRYREKVLPRIKQLQANKEYINEFGREHQQLTRALNEKISSMEISGADPGIGVAPIDGSAESRPSSGNKPISGKSHVTSGGDGKADMSVSTTIVVVAIILAVFVAMSVGVAVLKKRKQA